MFDGHFAKESRIGHDDSLQTLAAAAPMPADRTAVSDGHLSWPPRHVAHASRASSMGR